MLKDLCVLLSVHPETPIYNGMSFQTKREILCYQRVKISPFSRNDTRVRAYVLYFSPERSPSPFPLSPFS
jgi:hypothetical protein